MAFVVDFDLDELQKHSPLNYGISEGLPRVDLELREVGVSVKTRRASGHEPDSSSAKKRAGIRRARDMPLIKDISVSFLAGTTTLIMGGHGSGKSTLIETLAGRRRGNFDYEGSILVNGTPLDQTKLIPERLVGYVAQDDDHLPLITVRETLEFAQQSTGIALDPADRAAKVSQVISLLGLEECADTILGNEVIRGVSGGQKKRVTLGEMIMGNPRVIAADEYTTGLDSSTALDITRSLKQWAVQSEGTFVASLLQPTPEVFALFDRVVLLQRGRTIFAGKREDAVPYIEQFGLTCPSDQDYADFITEFLTHPSVVYARQEMEALEERLTGDELCKAVGDRVHEAAPKLVNSVLSAGYKAPESPSRYTYEGEFGSSSSSPHTSHYMTSSPLSFGEQTKLAIRHQAHLFYRDKKNLIFPRIFQAILISVFAGSFYSKLEQSEAAAGSVNAAIKILGFLLVIPANMAFFNMVELPIASVGKTVVHKYLDNKFLGASAYMVAIATVHIPLAVMDTVVFTTIAYFIAGSRVLKPR